MTSNQSAIGQQVSHVNNNYPKLKGEREWDGTQGDFFFFFSLLIVLRETQLVR